MRNTSVLAGLCLAVACFPASSCPRAHAQTPSSAPSAASPLPALSAEAQQKLNRLQAAARAAQASHNARKQAAALNRWPISTS